MTIDSRLRVPKDIFKELDEVLEKMEEGEKHGQTDNYW